MYGAIIRAALDSSRFLYGPSGLLRGRDEKEGAGRA